MTCEVEFKGTVKVPKKLPPTHKVWVYIGQGDCLAKEPHILGITQLGPDGSFIGEVFSRWGADVTFCAAAAEAKDKPSTLYGKLKTSYHTEAVGEIELKDLAITLQPGPARSFPAERPAL
ncbi:MAG: hypothetical protein U1A78_03875 [Polyangia bacterium]